MVVTPSEKASILMEKYAVSVHQYSLALADLNRTMKVDPGGRGYDMARSRTRVARYAVENAADDLSVHRITHSYGRRPDSVIGFPTNSSSVFLTAYRHPFAS